MRPVLFFLKLCFLLSGTLVAANAQGFYGGGVSARTAAQGGVYLPSSDNPLDALALNPAGLTALSAPTWNLSATGLSARGEFSNATNENSPMRDTRGVIPFGAFGTPLGDSRWSIGGAFTPDLLSSSNWQYRDTPGAAGVDYGRQFEKSVVRAFRTSAGAGYSFTPDFAVGASVSGVYNQNTLDAPYIFQTQPVLKGLKTILNLHTAGIGIGSSYGVRAKIRNRVELDAAYRTRTSITSTGSAAGNLSALFAALDVTSDPAFSYRAKVKVVMPQSALVSATWLVNARTRLSVQGDWIDWSRSFRTLPVSLTNGNNAVVNSLLESTSLNDTVPLDWKQQFTIRAGIQRSLGESFSFSAGYLHGNDPVPGSTLTPLTAAIMQNGLTSGLGYKYGRYRFDLSYAFDLTAQAQVGESALVAGEYSHSKVAIGLQSLTLSTSFQLHSR